MSTFVSLQSTKISQNKYNSYLEERWESSMKSEKVKFVE